jgi:hypothetical protein
MSRSRIPQTLFAQLAFANAPALSTQAWIRACTPKGLLPLEDAITLQVRNQC